MHGNPGPGPGELRYGPSGGSAAALALLAALLGAAAVGLPAAGAVLVGLGAAGALLAAGFAAAGGPAVQAGPEGLVVRDGWRLRRLAWAQVSAVRADTRRRARALEVDLGEHLVVVPAWLLGGADLRALAGQLERLRQEAGPG